MSQLKDAVINALRKVQDPDLHKDLVSLNMIRDLDVKEDGTVSLRVMLTTPACPLKAKIEGDVRAAVKAVPGVKQLSVKMDAEVRKHSAPQGSQSIEGVAHIIAVSSGKGGVGKSTVSVNLAVALAAEGARVGLLDADIYGPNLPTMMGVKEPPGMEEGPSGEVFLPPSAHGVKVLSIGMLVEGDQPLIWRGPMLHNVISQFCHKVKWGALDYLIVDMPPGTGDVQLSLAQLVPITGVVMVSTPQEVSMQDVRKAFLMFDKVRVPVLGIVENMSYFKCDGCDKKHSIFGQGGGRLLAEKFKTELLGEVPLLPQVREGGDEGKPIVLRDPQAEPAQILKGVARKVAQKVSILASENINPADLIQIGKFN
ncbi:MAG TPA: hypothetical protein DCS07_05285 [Bdellovibrionales bacterium]|nr:MAG: hypothetical protein A2Z97_03110 [Bdellovibrionales bacterium GWB1_52_6]OFZ06347.1 MAG: hypothetical protein A2X97_02695 [Bdellovibrionales bacterium GWA1_52_35]OFZ36571.1 MAG: hypothetical protein A2070_09520 [Bdellovibrionales bacterium GWC1_52_8]HAR42033.1 hypothetical protein [Bdellovibrionales bacterium]HCM40100.1 hypothetical protein [Bdellovibrionales bacterium]